ncbi:sodium:proton antiporter [Candidatus Kaiserbacteria bacterium CG10_big_fil_rev_8_21_14_0_10_44_10]|uniref:Sodium:proton antiporter n=1 Tax=Candidatus Kaiserbacteria bacterium CG10_big_fil_rev_8_21_14_0_10_44_10 TaxID=1974606 RepID=A0A2H0UGW9_9BACT|nr:MAG: sodium:proton antiporter [Candidatus Kaiserbacteria bacterium CG10_big_fil_rev_8_21_14_0_10_44_10]
MALIASIIFVVGYVLITLEHYWKVNKSITATALAAVLWALIAFTSPDSHAIEEALHIISAETFSLVVFLLAAMTLVEILVHYRFFDLLRAKLFSLGLKDGAQLILIGTLTFFLSAILDNLTTTIVMVQIARRFFKGHNLLVMAGMIVVAANAGGAFSPVGDVTTIMLWLAGKFSALDIILWAFLPSLSILLVSMLLFVKQLKKDSGDETPAPSEQVILSGSDKVVISMSFASFVLPPLAHLIGLPPFMGLLLGVGLVGLTIGWFSNNAKHRDSHMSMEIEKLLGKLDITSLLFFIGILFAVGALGFLGVLDFISASLFGEDPAMSRLVAGSVLLGAFSAILDNIPLTAAAIDILQTTDPHLWILLAICVGTGGSMLVIGSAAGVVAMGMVKELSFTKYLKIAAIPAALGYIAGIVVWYIQYLLLG